VGWVPSIAPETSPWDERRSSVNGHPYGVDRDLTGVMRTWLKQNPASVFDPEPVSIVPKSSHRPPVAAHGPRRPARYGALKACQLRAASSSSHFVCIASVGATMDQATFQDPSPSRLNPATKLTVWVVGWPDRLLSW
jgi:hypothetical protein